MTLDDEFVVKIHDWLNTQGYPLEMLVASAFKESGFSVKQSCFYEDPEKGTSREIDVIATSQDITWSRYVSYIIECKSCRDKPWILFTADNVLEGWNIFFTRAMLTEVARKMMIKATGERDLDDAEFAWLRESPRAGYGLTQAFTSGRDLPYEAILSVSKAAVARKTEMDKSSGGVFDAIFPVIIIEGRLFECFLNCGSKVQVNEIDEGVFFQPRRIGEILVPCIRLMTTKNLQEFSAKLHASAEVILNSISDMKDETVD